MYRIKRKERRSEIQGTRISAKPREKSVGQETKAKQKEWKKGEDERRSESDSVAASCEGKEISNQKNRKRELRQTCSVNELKGIAEMSAVVCDKDLCLDLCALMKDRVDILLRVRRELKEEDRL